MLPKPELVIVDKKLRIEHVQSLQFGKKIRRRIRHRTHRIFRMGLLPGFEFLMRSAEIEIVHRPVTILKPRRAQRNHNGSQHENASLQSQ